MQVGLCLDEFEAKLMHLSYCSPFLCLIIVMGSQLLLLATPEVLLCTAFAPSKA